MADSATKVRAQVIEGFAAVLSQLRDEAGRPSFRTMAGRSKAISHTTLHEAVQGNRLPSWGTTAEFVRACGADPRDYRERWEQANRIVGSATASDPTGPPSGPQSRAGTTDSPAAPDPGEPPSDAVLGGAPHGRAPSRRPWAWVVGVAALGLLVAGGAATWALAGRDENSPSSSSTQTSPQTAVVHSAAECPVHQQDPGSQPPAHEGDDVAFVDDVTLPDCTHVARGQSVQKVWRFRNTGTLTWRGYALQRVDLPQTRDQCQTVPEAPVRETRPGQVVDVRIDVTTPKVATFCFVRFKIVDASGAVAFPGNRPVNFQVVVDR